MKDYSKIFDKKYNKKNSNNQKKVKNYSSKKYKIIFIVILLIFLSIITFRGAKKTYNKKIANKKVTIVNKKKENSSLKFTFYNTLTKKTINVNILQKKPDIEYIYTYALQVGSYRSKSDATIIKKKLTTANLDAKIEKIGKWYRVDIRPIRDKREGDIIKQKVEQIGISGSILRQVSKEQSRKI